MSTRGPKWLQLVGVVLLLAGVAWRVNATDGDLRPMWAIVVGVALYAGGRIALWLKRD